MSEFLLKMSKVILNNQDEVLEELSRANDQRLRKLKITQNDDTQLEQRYTLLLFYNIFNSDVYRETEYPLLRELWKELVCFIKEFNGHEPKECWVSAWINYDEFDVVEDALADHIHQTKLHGYIVVDPKNTKTIFRRGFEIENRPSIMYIGPGDWWHRVKNTKKYDGTRVTIGFDVSFDKPKSPIWSKVE